MCEIETAVKLSDLLASAGVLPISERGLANIVEDLDDAKGLDPEDFIHETRYALRGIAGLLPPERYDLLTLGQVVGIRAIPYQVELYEAVNATGPHYEGEAPATVVRQLIGMVDDCVRPDTAARFLRIDEDEAALLDVFLDLHSHWVERMLDRVELVRADGGGARELGETLGIEGRWARQRLWRWGVRNLRKYRGSGVPRHLNN